MASLKELEKLCNAATPGPWEADEGLSSDEWIIFAIAPKALTELVGTRYTASVYNKADAAFIAAARSALPALVRQWRKVLPLVEAALDGIDRTETENGSGWWETSEGAAFGARVLEDVRALLRIEQGGEG